MTTTTIDPVQKLYRATTSPALVTVPSLQFLCIDGHGDPNTSERYAAAIQALYTLSYTAKFAVKKAGGENFRVSPLEGLWWADDPNAFTSGHKSEWNWTAMIRQPDVVTPELLDRLKVEVAAKKSLPALGDLRLVTFEEGAAAQVLHVGPYADEAVTIQRLHEFLRDQGFVLAGKHHEIYLGDPRRTAPARLRTLIRQPYTTS